MRQSTLFGRTLREAPAEAQTPGHRLMLRAAIARPLASGLYTWLPLGFRVSQKVEQIIREEMDRIGCQEMEMPILTPAELWKTTGRWDALEPITFRTRDHNGREFMVSYTHEEAIHSHAMSEIQSYKQLPVMVYHFQSKGRDETRPRAGLLRVREFVMKDAYSFDIDQAGLEKSYQAQHGAYERIFKRMSLDAVSVESDTGAMGGDTAHEFQVLTDVGEDRIVACPNCDYRANMEKATRSGDAPLREAGAPQRSEVATPSTTSIGKALAVHVDARDKGDVDKVGVAEIVAVELVAPSRWIEKLRLGTRRRAVERQTVERAGEAAVDELGRLGADARQARVVEGAALEPRLTERGASHVRTVEVTVAEDAARRRREKRRELAFQRETTEVAVIEETAAQ